MDLSSIDLSRPDSQPLYLRLAAAIVSAVERGELSARQRLPSERELALRLGVSRTTVVGAYRELESRGLVRGQVGRGTFVSVGAEAKSTPFAWRGKVSLRSQRALDPSLRTLLEETDPETISFAGGVPALDRFPTGAYRRLIERALRRGADYTLGLMPTEGNPELREAIAARCGVRPEEILVTNGAQQALDLVSRCLLDPADTVVTDRPAFLGALEAFRAADANVVGWDFQRADLGELEDLLLRYKPKFLYTNPSLQNPTGRTLSLATRNGLLRLASRYRLPILEDDAYTGLHFFKKPPEPLYRLDRDGLVVHVGSFSKTLGVGLRLGWVSAPEDIVDQLSLIKARSDLFTAGPTQLVVADMLTSGLYDSHVDSLRTEHRKRHDTMARALKQYIPPGALAWRPAEGGLYLWCRLESGGDARSLMRRASGAGVSFAVGEPFYGDGTGKSYLRMCFSGTPPDAIEEGVRRLAGLIMAQRTEAGELSIGSRSLI